MTAIHQTFRSTRQARLHGNERSPRLMPIPSDQKTIRNTLDRGSRCIEPVFPSPSVIPGRSFCWHTFHRSFQQEGWGDGLQGRGTLRSEIGADRFGKTRGEIRREHRKDDRREEEEIRYSLTRRFVLCPRAEFLSWMRGSPACFWLFGARNRVQCRVPKGTRWSDRLRFCAESRVGSVDTMAHTKTRCLKQTRQHALREFTRCRCCGHRLLLRRIAY